MINQIFLFFKSKGIIISLAISALLSACNSINIFQTTPSAFQSEATPYPVAMVTFRVTLQEKLLPGNSLFLTELDEVTGLAFNSTQHLMEAETDTTYNITIPYPVGSVVKYRYSRQGDFLSVEHQSDGRPVRYRIYNVTGPGEVNDIVARWTDTKYTNQTGRIAGRVLDSESNQPVPEILIAAGGMQTITLSDGSYLLEGLPPGIHNLTAYAIDGDYQTFQQGAKILAQSTTPADVFLNHTELVEVNFTVNAPPDTPNGAPLRIIGNLHQLGNTFGDLSGGVSTLATRAPVLTKQENGSYVISLTLPAGSDLHYKYTLGDGIWNAERTIEGNLQLRQLLIPNKDVQIEDRIESWKSGQEAPVTFEVEVPSNTPENETVFIQFNLGFGWFEAVPMWPLASPLNEKLWRYTLYGPLNVVDSFHYRYCRAGLCGSADDIATIGINPVGRSVNTSKLPQTILDKVDSWIWLPTDIPPANIPNIEVIPRTNNFIAGIAFQDRYYPSWAPRMYNAINDVISTDANWLVIHPTWTYTQSSPPILEILPNQDMLYSDIGNIMTYAQNQGLKIAIYPYPNFNQDFNNWWENASRDFPWWTGWFEQYEKFILHHADLAQKFGAEAIVLGGEWILPALPNGTLKDGSASNVPEDDLSRWSELLDRVRQRYDGEIFWASPFPGGLDEPSDLLNEFDGVYLLWSAPLATTLDADFDTLRSEAGFLIDSQVYPLHQSIGKPIIIAAEYPSAIGGITGCLLVHDGSCIPLNFLDPSNLDALDIMLDLQEQTDAYNAVLAAINERDWIAGFISEGYYPPLPLLDKSSSIHGKPANGTLWYWYPKLLEK